MIVTETQRHFSLHSTHMRYKEHKYKAFESNVDAGRGGYENNRACLRFSNFVILIILLQLKTPDRFGSLL